MTGINRVGASRVNGNEPMGATLRRTIDIALKQKDHSLGTRLGATCDMPRRDVNPMIHAAQPLYWNAVDQAQLVVGNDDRPEAVRFVREMEAFVEDDEMATMLSAFVDLIASAAFMEGWIAGSIHCQEQRVTRSRTRQQRPGR